MEDGPLTARALTYLGAIDATRGRSATALSRLEQAIELWQTVGDETESAAARDELGWALYEGGEEESRALDLFQQNLEHARRLGHHALVSRSLAGMCQMLVVTGQFERAEPLALELHASMRDSEDVVYMCAADHYLADCAMHRRDYTLAEQHRLSALETALTSENVMQQTIEILGLALTAAGLRRDEDALRLEGAVDAKSGARRFPRPPPVLRGLARARPRRSPCQARRAASQRCLRRRTSDDVGPSHRARTRVSGCAARPRAPVARAAVDRTDGAAPEENESPRLAGTFGGACRDRTGDLRLAKRGGFKARPARYSACLCRFPQLPGLG